MKIKAALLFSVTGILLDISCPPPNTNNNSLQTLLGSGSHRSASSPTNSRASETFLTLITIRWMDAVHLSTKSTSSQLIQTSDNYNIFLQSIVKSFIFHILKKMTVSQIQETIQQYEAKSALMKSIHQAIPTQAAVDLKIICSKLIMPTGNQQRLEQELLELERFPESENDPILQALLSALKLNRLFYTEDPSKMSEIIKKTTTNPVIVFDLGELLMCTRNPFYNRNIFKETGLVDNNFFGELIFKTIITDTDLEKAKSIPTLADMESFDIREMLLKYIFGRESYKNIEQLLTQIDQTKDKQKLIKKLLKIDDFGNPVLFNKTDSNQWPTGIAANILDRIYSLAATLTDIRFISSSMENLIKALDMAGCPLYFLTAGIDMPAIRAQLLANCLQKTITSLKSTIWLPPPSARPVMPSNNQEWNASQSQLYFIYPNITASSQLSSPIHSSPSHTPSSPNPNQHNRVNISPANSDCSNTQAPIYKPPVTFAPVSPIKNQRPELPKSPAIIHAGNKAGGLKFITQSLGEGTTLILVDDDRKKLDDMCSGVEQGMRESILSTRESSSSLDEYFSTNGPNTGGPNTAAAAFSTLSSPALNSPNTTPGVLANRRQSSKKVIDYFPILDSTGTKQSTWQRIFLMQALTSPIALKDTQTQIISPYNLLTPVQKEYFKQKWIAILHSQDATKEKLNQEIFAFPPRLEALSQLDTDQTIAFQRLWIEICMKNISTSTYAMQTYLPSLIFTEDDNGELSNPVIEQVKQYCQAECSDKSPSALALSYPFDHKKFHSLHSFKQEEYLQLFKDLYKPNPNLSPLLQTLFRILSPVVTKQDYTDLADFFEQEDIDLSKFFTVLALFDIQDPSDATIVTNLVVARILAALIPLTNTKKAIQAIQAKYPNSTQTADNATLPNIPFLSLYDLLTDEQMKYYKDMINIRANISNKNKTISYHVLSQIFIPAILDILHNNSLQL